MVGGQGRPLRQVRRKREESVAARPLRPLCGRRWRHGPRARHGRPFRLPAPAGSRPVAPVTPSPQPNENRRRTLWDQQGDLRGPLARPLLPLLLFAPRLLAPSPPRQVPEEQQKDGYDAHAAAEGEEDDGRAGPRVAGGVGAGRSCEHKQQ